MSKSEIEDMKKLVINIKIKNANIWAVGWITYYFYKLVDDKKIDSIEIKNVKKSPNSIESEIIAFLLSPEGQFTAGYLTNALDTS